MIFIGSVLKNTQRWKKQKSYKAQAMCGILAIKLAIFVRPLHFVSHLTQLYQLILALHPLRPQLERKLTYFSETVRIGAGFRVERIPLGMTQLISIENQIRTVGQVF